MFGLVDELMGGGRRKCYKNVRSQSRNPRQEETIFLCANIDDDDDAMEVDQSNTIGSFSLIISSAFLVFCGRRHS